MVAKTTRAAIALLCIALGSIKLYTHYESVWRYYPNVLDYALGISSIALGILFILHRGYFASPIVIIASVLKLIFDYRDPVDLLYCVFLIVASMSALRERLVEVHTTKVAAPLRTHPKDG